MGDRWSVCRGVDGIIIKTLNRKQKQFATLALDKQFLAVRKSADTDKSIGKRNEQSTLSLLSLSLFLTLLANIAISFALSVNSQ